MWHTFLANSANQAPFYSSFEATQSTSVVRSEPDRASRQKQSISEDVISKEVLSTVQNVLGSAVSENVPLVQAGLDSLGE